jgi:cold shock CspA family protein
MQEQREHRGTVTAFDDHRGYGEITTTTGERWFVHCTQIADGSRTIAVGASVVFVPLPRLGRYEATDVRPATP